jgi:hypothetical protein
LVRLGVDDGDAAGRGAVDVAAERCGATFGAAIAGLGGAFLAPVARFGLGFCALIFVVRRTVVFAAGLVAFIVRLTSCFAAAALPVFSLALPACLIGRFATVTLRVFSLALANRLIGRLAMVLRPSFFVLTAAIPAADFRLTGFAGRLAFVARPDDFDALLFVETAAAIGPSPLLPAKIARSSKLRLLPLVLQPKPVWVISAGGRIFRPVRPAFRLRRSQSTGTHQIAGIIDDRRHNGEKAPSRSRERVFQPSRIWRMTRSPG